MADISTLVDDLRKLLDQGHVTLREAPEIGAVISSRLEEHLRPRTEKTLRMSNIGKPDRQLWYQMNYKGPVPSISPDTKMKWIFGDILEATLIWLTEEAGHEVTDFQKEVHVGGICGHIDCKIDGVLVDVKSASSPSYKRFVKEEMLSDPFLRTYVFQLAGYCDAEGTDGGFLVMDKQNGYIKFVPWSREELAQVRVLETIEHKKTMVKQETVPERCYPQIIEDNGNERIPIGCSYCDHRYHCYSDVNEGIGLRTYKYSTGWKQYSKIVKEPRVEEITKFIKS